MTVKTTPERLADAQFFLESQLKVNIYKLVYFLVFSVILSKH